MSAYIIRMFDPVLEPAEAAGIRKLCEDFGSYRMYGEEVVDSYVGAGLPQRYEALRTYVKMEGLREGKAPVETAAAASEAERAISCLFRGTYASGYEVSAPGIEPLLYHRGFFEAARKIFGGSVIVPRYVFANILIPGMTLMTHTDIPEFRGASREDFPHWLLVVMHHSGLFDAWRVPIAAAVCWFNNCHGVSHPVPWTQVCLMRRA